MSNLKIRRQAEEREGFVIKTIKAQMLLTLVIFFILLFGVLGYTVFNQLAYMPEFIQQNHLREVEARADVLSNELEGIEDIVKIAANSPIVQEMDMEAIQDYLPLLMGPDNLRNLTVSDVTGQAWSTYDIFIDISDQEQYERIIVYDEHHILSEPFESPYIEGNNMIMAIAYSVFNEEGEKVGLVNAIIPMTFIEEKLGDMEVAEGGYFYIIDDQGRVISHPSADIGLGNHLSEWMSDQSQTAEVLTTPSGSLEYRNSSGAKTIGVYTEITGKPGWKMVMGVPASVAYAEYHSVLDYLLWAFIIGILLVTIFAYYYANTLSRPILALKSVFESAAAGNLNVQADASYPNELGKTGAAFNTMLSQIKDLTYRDLVTDLYNQNSFVLELSQKLKEKRDKNRRHYLLLVSIDQFKRLDSIGGVGAGDEVLKVLAKRLKSFIKKGEIIGRYYGDEIILYLESEDRNDFCKRLDRLRCLYYHPVYLKGVRHHLKTSIGITTVVQGEGNIKEKIKEVSIAKQEVKNSGGNGYLYYSEQIRESIVEAQKIEEALFYALINKEFYLVYQPILTVAKDRVVGHEALLRWNHEVHGKVPIPKVIDLAEKSGLIIEIGEWVLAEACRQNQQWIDQGYGPLMMAVNFSALQLADSKILTTVGDCLEKTGMDPGLLNIEITESVAMKHIEQKIELMNRLKKTGVTFSIDDFGTGYSSLSYFTNFPVDILKVDRSFVHNMLTDDNARAVTTTIIQMAKVLNLRIIAEGVETEAHKKALNKLGCTHYQGYLISPAVLPADCGEIMKKYGHEKID